MPRLLLVDDNPSIHKIAETLLAPTDIQLVCVESAKDALNLIAEGERFDVALLDIMMAGMDGWELLDQLRMHPATAGIPIAMMAGVLDTVDPTRLETASIQGFLKKPVELRDLGARVHTFLEARVEVAHPPAPLQDFSPFSTLPAVKLSELPEFRQASAPEASLDVEPDVADDDLLVLVEADLWPEVPPPPGTVTEDLSPFAEIPPEESLDLEELDLDSLKGLTIAPKAAAVEAEPALPEPVQMLPEAPEFEPSAFESVPPVELAQELESAPIPPVEAFPEEMASIPTQVLPDESGSQELPDLGPESEPTFDPEALAGLDSLSDEAFEPRPTRELVAPTPEPDPDFLSGLGEATITPGVAVVGWSDESEKMLGYLTPSQPLTANPVLGSDDDEEELDLGEPDSLQVPPLAMGFPLAEPLAEPWATGDLPVVPEPEPVVMAAPIAAPVAAPSSTDDLLRAITSDPVLMDHLAKALVAKLSDQVLREIAWDVMPEMAERLNRH